MHAALAAITFAASIVNGALRYGFSSITVPLALLFLSNRGPLAGWTMADVLNYARREELPLLPLYDAGYASIGCEPCTRLPPDPSNPRSGRWQGEKPECGIHSQPAGPKH